MDPNNKSKPQFKKYCSFCHKNNHSVSTCFRRLNMLKESKPQSRSPTPTFYQHFKNPSNKPHYSRHRSRSYSNPPRKSSRDTRYQSRSYSRSHSRPRYNTKTYSRTYSPYHNRDRSRYDKHYNHTQYKPYSSTRSYYSSNSSRSPSKYYPRSRERSSNFNTSTFNRYNSPYRPPSKPRNDRYRSRSHSNSHNHPQTQYKPSINLTHPSTPPPQTNSQTESIFEINMYHSNISSPQFSSTSSEHANAITPSTWFVNLYIFKPSEDTSIPSKLELLFLLDSGASICVLNLPTFTILAEHFLKSSTHSPHQNEYKTLTVANKSEIPILHNIILTLHTSLNGNTRTLVIPFAVAYIKYNILGTPFFEKYVKTLNIENMFLTFNTPHESRINTLPFTAHKEKDYPYFSYIYTINVKIKIYFKPNASQIIHFPIQPTLPLTFKTSDNEVIFPSTPHPFFNTRFNSTFNFLQVYQNVKTEPSTCSVIIQIITHHSATLTPGYIGYIEVPATNIQPSRYKVNDVNSLIHSVFHSYYPDLSEPKPPRRRSSLRNPQIEINNLQPSQILTRPLPPLPYSPDTQQFLNKFKFQYSDVSDEEYLQLCSILVKYRTCYATHKNDVGQIATPFRIRLKPNAKLQTQRPTKVPIHYREELKKLLDELEKHNIIRQIGSTPSDKYIYGTKFLNPLIIIPKGDTIKVVLDARHLNSNTDQSFESWPIEPLAPQLARANKKFKSAIDLMYAYAHAPLDEETITSTSFSSGDKLYAFIRGFYGLKGLPNFFTKQLYSFFQKLIDQGFALVYIDDILLLAHTKPHMLNLIEQLHQICQTNNLKIAPEKSFYILLTVKFLGHEIGNNTIKPISSKIDAIHQIKTPTSKTELMRFIGSMNFYSKFINKLHISLKPFYTLLHDDISFEWTPELDKLFNQIKLSLSKDAELAIPNTTHPFYITVDASLIGLGAVLFQPNSKNKMQIISYNSRILTTQEQKLSTYDRELCAITFALSQYEFIIIGSKFPITVFTDHNPILFLFTRKGNLTPRQYKAQMLLTKFSNLQIIHTAGTNRTVADMLSRDFSTINAKTCQLHHKTLPPHIDFLQLKQNNILKPIHYLVKHEDVLPTQKNDSHLILADYGDDQFTLRIQDKGNVVKYTPLDSFSFQSVSSFLNKYKKPVKNKVKTLLQENPLLNETDLYDTDDPVLKRISQQYSQTSHELHTFFTEVEHHYFNDINLSQDILTNFINSPPIINHTLHSNAITPTSPKTINTQSLPFFDPSFFAHRKAFDNFFLPSDTFLTLPILLQAQKDDPVLSTVYTWLKQKQRPHSLTPIIKANSFLYTYYKQFQQLYLDPNSHLIQYYTPNSRIFEEIFLKTQPSINQTRICLPFKLFYAAFNKTHSHGHSGEKLSIKTFNQFYFIPHLPLWFSIFTHDCIDCQTNKHFLIKPQNISPPLPFYENATHFNYRISMDTKGPISPSSQNNSYIFVIIEAFSHFVVTNPAPNINSKYAIQTLLHHWITKFGPPQYLVTDRGTEYINQDMAHLCSLFHINHSPRTPYSPWTNGLVEVQNRNLGTHLRIFLQNPPTNWSFQTQMYAYAHNTTPLSQLKLSPYQIVFHTHPRIPLTFSLNLPRDAQKNCIATYCESLSPHSHYSTQDLNPFFHSLLDKPISSWLLAAETAMLEIYSTVHRHINHKLNSQSSTFETTHLKQLPLNTFVIHTNFKPVNFSKKLKPLRIGPYKILKHLSEVTYELLSQDGSTFQTHRNHILPYYPKEPIIFPYIKHYHSTPSLINNPDTDSYQDTFSQFSSLDLQHNSNSSQTPPSSKSKHFNSFPPSIPNYQNLSHYSSLQDHLDHIPFSTTKPLQSSSSQDNLDNTIDSHDSDFEMLPNPIYYSNSSPNSFPQFFSRVADSPDTSSSSLLESPNEPTYQRAPHSPYNLRSLPPRHYNSSKPNISFPP